MVCQFHLGKLEEEFPALADSVGALRLLPATEGCGKPVRCVALLTLRLVLLSLLIHSDKSGDLELGVEVSNGKRVDGGEGDEMP